MQKLQLNKVCLVHSYLFIINYLVFVIWINYLVTIILRLVEPSGVLIWQI